MREISYFAAHGLNTGFVRIFYFPKQLYFNEITFPPQSPYSSQTGHGVAGMVLRNVAPRQGTEIITVSHFALLSTRLRNVAPRQGTEITDVELYCIPLIEKCSSPIGDGKSIPHMIYQLRHLTLRNVAPRQGTESMYTWFVAFFLFIEKCSSPIGDGKAIVSILLSAADFY